jgi:hypothetical protein
MFYFTALWQGDDLTLHFVTACRRYPAMGQLEIYLLLN